MTETADTTSWQARPLQARLIRLFALLAPIAASTLFVHLASRAIAPPGGSFWLYAVWWIGLSGAATIVLVAIDRLCRRLLPLAALLRLSLVFPDQAPSRFRAAMAAGTVKNLEQRLAEARKGRPGETPLEAAERLLGLVAALDVHDRLTRGHSERVRAYSQLIGKELGLSKREVDLLNWSALLHDVGKLGVATAILTKPGKPDDDEWQILRSHPLLGEELVAPLRAWLGEWADAVGHHHERWDGAGYPRGLAGDEIAFAGRIVAVADVFDVMTSARSYKSAGGTIEAREEIARCAEAQFDPRVVRAFLAVSLGRLRFAMGPLSWLAHAPILGRIPLTPAIGAVSGTVAAATAAVATGLVAPPPDLTVPLRAPAALAATASVPVGSSVRTRPDEAPAGTTSTPGNAPRPVADDAAPAPVSAPAAEPPAQTPTGSTTPEPAGNGVPELADDGADTAEEEPVSVDVLANDRDPDGDALRLTGIDSVSIGTASVADGRVRWSPPHDFHGEASLVYAASDGRGGSSTARVAISVTAVNDPPVAADDSVTTGEEALVPVLVLANDTDADGDDLQLDGVTQPAAGTVQATGSAVVYAPPKDFTGHARFTYRVGDRRGGFATAAVDVEVVGANDPPVAVADAAAVVEGGSVEVDVVANDTDVDGDSLRLVAVGAPGAGTAELVAGRVRYAAPADASGVVSFSYTVSDPAGATATGTVSIQVTSVNDPPSFTAGGNQAVLEDAGATTVAGWASAIGAGPPDESGQAVSFLVTSDDAALFSAGPAVGPDGTLTFTPAPDANGTATVTVRAHDDGGTASGGVDTSAPQAFTITVKPVNDAPSFAAGANVTVFESAAAAQTVEAGWASRISPGPDDESGQAVAFVVSSDNPALFSAVPAVASNGTLAFTPAAGANGVATVTVKAKDDGGVADGGADRSAPQTFTITIVAVNSRPTFTAGAGQTVLEDAGPQSVAGWATGISPGPADESAQTVSFLVSNDNPGLFAAAPAVAADGTLTFTPAADANGTATVTVRAKDDGGTANGGSDTGESQTFTIAVTPVNDAPSFTAGGDRSALEDAGTQSLPGWATAISAGPPNEAGQSVSFDVTNDDASLFSAAPAVAADGTLTFTPAANAAGSATVSVHVHDDGGTANGGVDGSADQVFTITVTAAPDPPVASDDAVTLAEDTPGGATFSVLANDSDPDGDALGVASFDASGIAHGTLTDNGGGSFTYVPETSFAGAESFAYTVSDGNGGTDTATVSITVTPVPDAPLAASDAYTIDQDTALCAGRSCVQPAPAGLLANDADDDGDALSVELTPVTPPAHGSLTLSADGSFSYTPDAGWTGTDTFVYRADDGTGRTATATATITVDSTVVETTLYLRAGPAASEVWTLDPAAPPAASPVPDYDADGSEGLTLKPSNNGPSENDPRKRQEWTYPVAADLALNGPVTLELWGTTSLLSLLSKEVRPYTYLYDCAGDGTGCTLLAQNVVSINPWNGLLGGWVSHDILVGSVDTTIAAGRQLRLLLLVDRNTLYVAMTGAFPSHMHITVAGP